MSSVRNKFISNQEAIPIIDNSSVFDEKNKQFAIGVFSPSQVLSYEAGSPQHAYLQLRANVYIDQTRMLGSELRRADNTEVDQDDERSVALVVFENLLGRVAVCACMRLIVKTDENSALLPIEDFFPDSFPEGEVPIGGVEVSRFIVRHDERHKAREARGRIMAAAVAYILRNQLGPLYGVVEPELETALRIGGVRLRRMADPKLVEEYNDENLGIEVDVPAFEERFKSQVGEFDGISSGEYYYWGDVHRELDED